MLVFGKGLVFESAPSPIRIGKIEDRSAESHILCDPFFFLIQIVFIFLAIIWHLPLVGAVNLFLWNQSGQDLDMETEKVGKVYKCLVGQMTVENFLTISNLQHTKASIFCRKFCLYANLIFNICILLVLFLLCNLKVPIEFEGRPLFGWAESCLVIYSFICNSQDTFTWLNVILETAFVSLMRSRW